jgi:hypothetical protein
VSHRDPFIADDDVGGRILRAVAARQPATMAATEQMFGAKQQVPHVSGSYKEAGFVMLQRSVQSQVF